LHQPWTKWCNPCAATFVEEEKELVAALLPIKGHREREQSERERVQNVRDQERK